MSYYRNASGRPLSVTISKSESALVPPNCFVSIDPQVERRYDTKRLTSLGHLVRCGRPGSGEICIQVVSKVEPDQASIAPSDFAEALTEFTGTVKS